MNTAHRPVLSVDDEAAGSAGSRAQDLLDVATTEADHIVLGTAVRIRLSVAETERELRQLKTTVDLAAGQLDHSTKTAERSVAPLLRPSDKTCTALAQARQDLDQLLAGISAPPATGTRVLQLRTWPAIAATGSLLAVVAALGVATGWLNPGAAPGPDRAIGGISAGTTGRLSAGPTPDALAATAPESPGSGDPSAPALPGQDHLRTEAAAWIRGYFERGAATVPGQPDTPAVHDERGAAERRPIGAVRRVITPGRIDIVGDAAVLSASVAEHPSNDPGRPRVSLVAQLWTRTTAGWHLDDVRIVSAASAADAFGR